MNWSNERNNWLTVGEIIRLIKEPVALYTSNIIEKWHAKLCGSLPGKCSNPGDCVRKKKCNDLCLSCKGWYDKLVKSHGNKDKRQIKWRENCDTSKWPNDPWEVAKFFMPALGNNKITVKNADSTDLSSLLNVLAWMENAAFAPDRRVDLNLVTQLRSEVRNRWAHAPDQELADATLKDAFDIAKNFVRDLDRVFSCDELKKCIEDIEVLKAKGLSNATEEILNFLRVELCADVSQMKDDRSSDRQVIKNLEEKLELLEKDIESLHRVVNVQVRQDSCIPDKPETFIGRDAIVKTITSSLVEKGGCGIATIVGGPGFGKSTVAVEVSHCLRNDHDIVVIFSYLRNIATVPEVILRLCHDVGVNPGDDSKSSLMFWLKSIEKNVVLVMDNIEQLLESDVKSQFNDLLLTLRKNSRLHLQILTTSRTKFVILGHTVLNHQLEELDEKSSIELLKMCCPDIESENAYLPELAKLCGFVPLALCIAGSRIQGGDNLLELIQWLKEMPMDTLRNSDHCVQQTFEFSFQKLSDEDKKAFVYLSVFEGSFQRDSAKAVIQRGELQTENFLELLVGRSLVQKTIERRFVIHSLIRRFLSDHDQFQDEKAVAQGLMVSHFLKMCHSLTMDCYSHNGFTSARESLKKNIQNIEKTHKICSQDLATNSNPNISEHLASSDIYKFSYRFFHNFSWDLLPETVLKNFFKSCISLAESTNEPVIKILFQCLAADQEGRKSAWKSEEYAGLIQKIEAAFEKNKAALKEDRFVFMFCYQLLARYQFNNSSNCLPADPTKDGLPSLPENKVLRPIEKVAEAYILMKRGNISKMYATKRSNKVNKKTKKKDKEYRNFAKSFYNDALSLAKEVLGDHALTCSLLKHVGDVCFNWGKKDTAMTYYSEAVNLHKKLKLDSNEQFVMLLKNCGGCLSFLRCFDKSVETLKEARDIADKIAEEHTLCKAKVNCQLAITFSSWKSDCQEAVQYAKEAKEMLDLLNSRDKEILEKIIKSAEEYKAVQSIVDSLPEVITNHRSDGRFRLNSCIPKKTPKFTGHCTIVKEVISSIVENGCEIVSLVGPPGIGKTTVAIEISHHLREEHDIVVIFSCLSYAVTVPEVLQRICHDVGVNPVADPESSLTFWLKSIERKVVLVMDNIEQLLESDVKSYFIELLLTLRKISSKNLQILTTSRTQFVIPEQTSSVNHHIQELDESSSVELLRKCCLDENVQEAYLSKLAKRCAFVPLALCVTGTLVLDPHGVSESIQWLKKNCASGNVDHRVQKAIQLSFQKLSKEDQKALVRLSVFDGNFATGSAEEVIEKSESKTMEFLEILVRQSLIQRFSDKRFVIHSLIRQFLINDDQFQDEKERAQRLMVRHFLKMCHSLTLRCFSNNGFTSARDSLREDIHNVEKTLRICSHDEATKILKRSDIYNSTCWFFYSFSWDLLQGTVLSDFFEFCIKLAESRKPTAIEITFRCLVANQEGHKSAWKSPEYFDRVNDIAVALQKNKTLLRKDRSLFTFCYCIFARFDSKKAKIAAPPNLSEKDFPPLQENQSASPIEKAAEAYFLMERGSVNKKDANKVFRINREKYNEKYNCAEKFHKQALSLAKEFFGDHELTCVLHKRLGDLYFDLHKTNEAMIHYSDAIILRKKLKIDSNEHFAFLLKSCGACLSYLGHFDESVAMLKKARDMVGKHTYCRASMNYALAKACRAWKSDCQEAAGYAKEAMDMQELLESHTEETLKKIIQTAKESLNSLEI
ncbi:uncharacterized protein LOC114520907 [Dendronephthya gigantea]|uniref:uncharacterized protein LOC114520907 n=1 Tax=Dendronephthya gigantea TaxID=151771 RepID=UPI00106A3FC2|nr:uncharacterized protein LOC114520907 [Dendronephthya gigantea]XP_028397058.1 uncharacterized protein LOC114520907 [Dendronephthya gigantea]